VSTTFLLRLPAPFERALLDAVPGFQSWTLADYWKDIRTGYGFTMRQAPWAVIGDFNGDGWCDLVVDGHDKTKSYRLVVWGGQKPKVQTLATSGPRPAEGLDSVLQYYGPGTHGTNFSDDSIELFTDGFNDYIWEKAGTLYYWKIDHFEQFTSSD
jgi:hypothetical protein